LGDGLTAERVIHLAIFNLLLVGLCGVIAWVIITYVQNDLLKFGGVALSWGVVLLALYTGFKQLGWEWWLERKQEQAGN
jgi:uncharacterized membrane protein YbhN (UPF0104 family)